MALDIENLLRSTGYPALFLGSVLEGETTLILASLLAYQGILDLTTVIAVAYVGAICGDQLFYFLGRLRGRSFIRRRPHWQHKLARVEDLLQRYHLPMLLSFRFLYGLRGIVPFAVGLSGLGPRQFSLLNAVGALLWAVSVGWGIYQLAGWIQIHLPGTGVLKTASIVLTLVVLAGIWLGLKPFSRSKR
jgi:membrane protein DedA with SNARE-associated domain